MARSGAPNARSATGSSWGATAAPAMGAASRTTAQSSGSRPCAVRLVICILPLVGRRGAADDFVAAAGNEAVRHVVGSEGPDAGNLDGDAGQESAELLPRQRRPDRGPRNDDADGAVRAEA